MADMARVTNDEEMYAACERLWDSIVKEKLYVTGGIGGTHIGESFSYPYDLPNDTAYSETCAAIGLAFFARRMLEIRPDSKISYRYRKKIQSLSWCLTMCGTIVVKAK